MNGPILITTDFTKQFKLAVDASDVGVDAVLFQEVSDVDRPILFCSKKLDQHQANYSTIEKECFALLSALQHAKVYHKLFLICRSWKIINSIHFRHNWFN
jgi:regulator of RNase E activity RraB